MKTLRKMDLVSMEKEFQVLENPEKFLGGTSIDDCISYFESQGLTVKVYTNPDTIPTCIWDLGAQFASVVGSGPGTLMNPIVLPEVTVTGSRNLITLDYGSSPTYLSQGTSPSGCPVCNAFYNQDDFFDFQTENSVLGPALTYFNEFLHLL